MAESSGPDPHSLKMNELLSRQTLSLTGLLSIVAVTRIEQISHGSGPHALTFVLNGNILQEIFVQSVKLKV